MHLQQWLFICILHSLLERTQTLELVVNPNNKLSAQRCFCEGPTEAYILTNISKNFKECTDTGIYIKNNHTNVPPYGIFQILPQVKYCPNDVFPIELEEKIQFFNENSIKIEPSGISRPFCIDRTDYDTTEMRLFGCFVDEDIEDPFARIQYFVFASGMIISLPCLILTFLIYALIPELRNLHGKSLMSHVACMIVAFIFLSLVQLEPNINETMCMISGFTIQFFFLGSFFWLNIMCFDIFWTFSGFRGFRGSLRERERRKFTIYSAYAWTSPFLIVLITIIAHVHPKMPKNYTPRMGDGTCWFGSTRANIIYFYVPVSLIVISNIVMFGATAYELIRLRRETSMLKHKESRLHNVNNEINREKLMLYLKLFIVMGINWSMEIISLLDRRESRWWIITDFFNCLQGVLIFIIFVCKRKIIRLLKKRFYPQGVQRASSNPTQSFSMYTSKGSTHSTSPPTLMSTEN